MKTKILSGREARREQERRERKQAASIPEWKKRQIAAKAALIERLSQNGITPNDLRAEYDKGFNEGFKRASEPIIKGCYAAICLALHDLYGFGAERCKRVLRAVDGHLIYTLTGEELIEQVLNDMDLEIRMDDPIERVADKEG